MDNFKKWLLAALVVVALGGVMLVIDRPASRAVAADDKGAGDHWRNFDGHWSYWHEGDKRWYYTDGTHWYYNNGTSWVLYHFDKLFGLTGFHHGDYKAPGPEAKISLPTHGVYRRP
jgi:hypothetical protein